MVTDEMIRAAFEDARAACGFNPDEGVPNHAYTYVHYARAHRIPLTTAAAQLKRMVSAGALKSGRKLGITDDGKQRVQTYYWRDTPVKKAAKR